MAHDRLLDHYGTEPDTSTVLDTAIGRYAAGTDLHTMLVDMVARLEFIEANLDTRVFGLTADAWLYGFSSLTLDAYFHAGGIASVTANASISGTIARSLSADAFLIETVECL